MSVANPMEACLHSTVLRVSNLERSVEWYRAVLKMMPVYRDFSYRLVNMVGENAQRLTLWECAKGQTVATSTIDGIYPVFATPDAVAWRDEVMRRGADVGPIEYDEGLVMFWIYDPDKHAILMMQFLID